MSPHHDHQNAAEQTQAVQTPFIFLTKLSYKAVKGVSWMVSRCNPQTGCALSWRVQRLTRQPRQPLYSKGRANLLHNATQWQGPAAPEAVEEAGEGGRKAQVGRDVDAHDAIEAHEVQRQVDDQQVPEELACVRACSCLLSNPTLHAWSSRCCAGIIGKQHLQGGSSGCCTASMADSADPYSHATACPAGANARRGTGFAGP